MREGMRFRLGGYGAGLEKDKFGWCCLWFKPRETHFKYIGGEDVVKVVLGLALIVLLVATFLWGSAAMLMTILQKFWKSL